MVIAKKINQNQFVFTNFKFIYCLSTYSYVNDIFKFIRKISKKYEVYKCRDYYKNIRFKLEEQFFFSSFES